MQLRKVSAEEAARWPQARSQRTRAPRPGQLAALIAALPDTRGITRIDLPGTAGGEHAWRARVYTRNIELHQQFSDAAHGGVAAALAAAVAWRDNMRQLAGPRPPARGATPRVVRVDGSKHCGWIAYRRWARRYVADSAWGGRDAAEAEARAWLAADGDAHA